MSELIERQAVIDALAKIAREKFNLSDEYNHYLAGLMDGELAIKGLPTVQPEPKEGHWINGKCDRCGEHAPFWAMASTYHRSNYCPNCGARMKGVRHEGD